MFFYEYLVELFFAKLTCHQFNFLLFLVFLAFALLFLLFFYRLNCWPEIFRGGFPIVACLIETLSFSFSKFFLLLNFVLLYDLSLNCNKKITCSFEVNLLASELNYFLFDMKTNLQALACFSNAFRLNFLPQPSGHSTSSFSLTAWSTDSSTSSSWIGFSNLLLPTGISSTMLTGCSIFFYYLTSTFLGYSLTGSLEIKILFFSWPFGCSVTAFFCSMPGESWITSLRSSLGSLIWRDSFGAPPKFLLSVRTVFDLISIFSKSLPDPFSVDYFLSILPLSSLIEVLVLLKVVVGSYEEDDLSLYDGSVNLNSLPPLLSELWEHLLYYGSSRALLFFSRRLPSLELVNVAILFVF